MNLERRTLNKNKNIQKVLHKKIVLSSQPCLPAGRFSVHDLQGGQALITLLFFVIISILITSAAVVLILVNSLSQTKFQQSSLAYELAQSGIEEAELRLLRDPNYGGEQPFIVGSGTVEIQRTGTNPYVFLSIGKIGNIIRKIQVTLQYQTGAYTITRQQEVF